MESECPVCCCWVRPGAYSKDLKSHSNTTKHPGQGGCPAGAGGGWASGEGAGWLERLLWSGSISSLGLGIPLFLSQVSISHSPKSQPASRPVTQSRAGNSATGMPLYLQTAPHITATHINSNSCGSTEKEQGGLTQVVTAKLLVCHHKVNVSCVTTGGWKVGITDSLWKWTPTACLMLSAFVSFAFGLDSFP